MKANWTTIVLIIIVVIGAGYLIMKRRGRSG